MNICKELNLSCPQENWQPWFQEGGVGMRGPKVQPRSPVEITSHCPRENRLQDRFSDVFTPLPRLLLVWLYAATHFSYLNTIKLWFGMNSRLFLTLWVIEDSHSDWNSLVVLVAKADGLVHFCLEFRNVNTVSNFMHIQCLALMSCSTG